MGSLAIWNMGQYYLSHQVKYNPIIFWVDSSVYSNVCGVLDGNESGTVCMSCEPLKLLCKHGDNASL